MDDYLCTFCRYKSAHSLEIVVARVPILMNEHFEFEFVAAESAQAAIHITVDSLWNYV